MEHEDDFLMLRFDFEREAERRHAEEKPGDPRHREAVAILDRLAATTSEVPPALLREYHDLFRDDADLELHSKRLRQIGLQYFPSTAEEFVRDGILMLSRK